MMFCYVMLCYVMFCYVMLCFVMLCYVFLTHRDNRSNEDALVGGINDTTEKFVAGINALTENFDVDLKDTGGNTVEISR
jgi:hypothetical protein